MLFYKNRQIENKIGNTYVKKKMEKEMGNHSSTLGWRIPRTGAWRATVHGITESDTAVQLSLSCEFLRWPDTPNANKKPRPLVTKNPAM